MKTQLYDIPSLIHVATSRVVVRALLDLRPPGRPMTTISILAGRSPMFARESGLTCVSRRFAHSGIVNRPPLVGFNDFEFPSNAAELERSLIKWAGAGPGSYWWTPQPVLYVKRERSGLVKVLDPSGVGQAGQAFRRHLMTLLAMISHERLLPERISYEPPDTEEYYPVGGRDPAMLSMFYDRLYALLNRLDDEAILTWTSFSE